MWHIRMRYIWVSQATHVWTRCIWMSHVTQIWMSHGMGHHQQTYRGQYCWRWQCPCHTHPCVIIRMRQMKESCHTCVNSSHMNELYMNESYHTHINKSCHTISKKHRGLECWRWQWSCHTYECVKYEWVTSHRYEWVMSHHQQTYRGQCRWHWQWQCQTHESVSCEWVTSMSHVTHIWMCHVWMSHVTHIWTSEVTPSWNISGSMSHVTHIWHASEQVRWHHRQT